MTLKSDFCTLDIKRLRGHQKIKYLKVHGAVKPFEDTEAIFKSI